MSFATQGFPLYIGVVNDGALSRWLSALATELGARLQGRATLRARSGLHRSAALLAKLGTRTIDRPAVGTGNATATTHTSTIAPARLRVIALAMMAPATVVATEKSFKETHDVHPF
jgi:hypothetical protein